MEVAIRDDAHVDYRGSYDGLPALSRWTSQLDSV